MDQAPDVVTVEGERAYPTYQVDFRWTQDAGGEEYPEAWTARAGTGRFWSSTSYDRMYREDPGQQTAAKWAGEWWSEYSTTRIGVVEKNPSRLKVTVRGPRWETWCLSWFSHWTWDNGRSDEEFLASFERYVRRYEHMARWDSGRIIGDPKYVCLMGAEDRWRWRGSTEDSKAPCRCEGCTKNGVVRICH